MTFLNPAALFALFAVTIPILIHIFNLSKVQKVEFSTLMLLKELQKTKLKRFKLEQLLLLILRVLMIIFLVLSFAKPVFKGYAGDSGFTRKTAVILIDDSFSMSVKTRNGTFFDEAKRIAGEIIGSYSKSDEVYLIPSSSIGKSGFVPITGNLSSLMDSVGNLNIGFKNFDYNSAMNEVDLIIKNSVNVINEVFLITDFQNSNFSNTGITVKFNTGSEKETALFLIDVNSRKPDDLELTGAELKTGLILPGSDIVVSAAVNNYSDFNAVNKNVLLFINNKFISDKYVDVGSNSSVETEFEFNVQQSGNVSGRIELANSVFAEDEISENNVIYFSINIPSDLNIAMLGSEAAELNFLQTALASTLPGDLSGNELKQKVYSDINEITQKDNVVVLNSVSNLNEQGGLKLREFLNAGGGIMIFPEVNGNQSSVNNFLKSINAPEFGGNITDTDDLKIIANDPSHPVIKDIFTAESFGNEIESPKFRRYVTIIPSANSRVILKLSDGNPFLTESEFGKGRILVFSVTPDMKMSDFPLKGIFAPLIVRGSFYVGNDVSSDISHTIGEANTIDLRRTGEVSNVRLPDGKVLSVEEFTKQTGMTPESRIIMFPYSAPTAKPGTYIFNSDKQPVGYSLNPPKGEGNLVSPGKDEISERFSQIGFGNVIYSGSDFHVSLLEQHRSGMDIWWIFLLFAVACILSEIFLIRYIFRN